MKELRNGIKIIGIDHGYGNIKTANTVTPTGITAYTTEPTFGGNILVYDGMYYRMERGAGVRWTPLQSRSTDRGDSRDHKPFVADKSTDNDFYIFTLMAIARELSQQGISEAEVHIAAGLPLTWVKTQREDFRSYITRNNDVRFVYRDKPYHIRIVGCSVYPQGYTAVIDRLHEMTGVNMLADIGNGTMNVIVYSSIPPLQIHQIIAIKPHIFKLLCLFFGICCGVILHNKKPVESKCYTEKLGVNQCVISAKNAVMDKLGVKIDDTIIEQVIRFGNADISEKYLNCIIDAVREYCSEIFETLRKYEYNPDLMRLYVTGGGGCLIKNFGEYDDKRVTIIDDICATAKGYEQLAYMTLRKKVCND